MSLLVGDDRDKKEVAYMGMQHCSSCNSLSHFSLYEVENNYKALFIPIPNFDKSYVFLCDNCGSGIEIRNVKVPDILKDFKHIHSREKYNIIFSEIKVFKNTRINLNDSLDMQLDLLTDFKRSLEFKYENSHLDYVFDVYARYLKNSLLD